MTEVGPPGDDAANRPGEPEKSLIADKPIDAGNWVRFRDRLTLNFGSPAATLAALIGIATLTVTILHWKADTDAAVPQASMWISPSLLDESYEAVVYVANRSKDPVRLIGVEIVAPPEADIFYQAPGSPLRKKLTFGGYAAPGNSTEAHFRIKHSDVVTNGKEVTVRAVVEHSGEEPRTETLKATVKISDDWFK